MARLGVVLLALCSGAASAATTYNLERDFKTSGTRAVAFFRTDPLLGVPSADSSAPAAGIVRHFRRGDGALVRTLESPAPATGDRFGFAIAVAGTLIVVGAPGDDAAGVDSGAVFVFDATTGAHVGTLHAPSPIANAQFGFSVAARGDDIIVGAPFAGGAQVDAGAAYLFDGASGDLLLTFTNDGASGDEFGAAVARAGNDVLVGAPLDGGVGAAFLFDGATGARLNAFRGPQAAAGDLFGASVAPIGGDVIIGAPFAEGDGAVYRFDRRGETPNETYLPPDIPPTGATAFGTALATVGRDFLVSAPGGELEENPAAFVIDGATGNVIQTLFPLVPIPLRDRFDPPLAASGRDVLVEDALFKFCGRACVEECGNGIVEADLGETCDDGDDTNSVCPDCVRGGGTPTSTTSTTTSTTSPTSTTTSPTSSTSTTSTTTSPTSSTSTTSTTTSPTSTSPGPSATSTSTSTSPTPSVTSSTALRAIPGAICLQDADCSGPLCEGASRCIEGRCRAGEAPVCFAGATCVLSAALPSTSCADAPPPRVTRLLERAYVLVLGAEAAAPSSLQRAKRRLRAAAKQLARDAKLVGELAGKGRLAPSCADALTAAITHALERTNALRTDLVACAS